MPRTVSNINVKVTGSVGDLKNKMTQANAAVKNLGRSAKKTNDGFTHGANKLGAYITRVAAAYAAFQSFRLLLEGFLDTLRKAGEAQQAEVAFKTMLGSATAAKNILEDLYEFVRVTPFRLDEVRDGAKSLVAFGFSTQEVLPTLKSLGDISAGVGVPLTELTTLLGKARVEGKQYTRDLRQFATAGVPIYEELAKQLGVTTSQVTKFAEEGQIGARHVEAAIASLTAEGSQFGGLMAESAKTMLGVFSNLLDAVDDFKRAIGKELLQGRYRTRTDPRQGPNGTAGDCQGVHRMDERGQTRPNR